MEANSSFLGILFRKFQLQSTHVSSISEILNKKIILLPGRREWIWLNYLDRSILTSQEWTERLRPTKSSRRLVVFQVCRLSHQTGVDVHTTTNPTNLRLLSEGCLETKSIQCWVIIKKNEKKRYKTGQIYLRVTNCFRAEGWCEAGLNGQD